MPLRFGSVVNETVSINISVHEGHCDGNIVYVCRNVHIITQALFDVVDEQQYTEKASFDLHVQHQNLCMLKFNLKGTAAVYQSHYFAKQGVQDTPKLKAKNLLWERKFSLISSVLACHVNGLMTNRFPLVLNKHHFLRN